MMAAQGAGSLTISDQVVSSSTFDVQINLSAAEDIQGFFSEIEFNASHLELTNITWSSTLDQFAKEFEIIDGKARIAGAGQKLSVSSADFATLNFKRLEGFNEDSTWVVIKTVRWNEGEETAGTDTSTIILTSVGDKDEPALPNGFSLSSNYPNPFNPQTTIVYKIARNANVSLIVYNLMGQQIRTLFKGHRNRGTYTATWDGRNKFGQGVSSGLYFYRLVGDSFVATKKMLLLK